MWLHKLDFQVVVHWGKFLCKTREWHVSLLTWRYLFECVRRQRNLRVSLVGDFSLVAASTHTQSAECVCVWHCGESRNSRHQKQDETSLFRLVTAGSQYWCRIVISSETDRPCTCVGGGATCKMPRCMLHRYNLIYTHPQPNISFYRWEVLIQLIFFHLENDRLAGACVCVRVNGIVLFSLA